MVPESVMWAAALGDADSLPEILITHARERIARPQMNMIQTNIRRVLSMVEPWAIISSRP